MTNSEKGDFVQVARSGSVAYQSTGDDMRATKRHYERFGGLVYSGLCSGSGTLVPEGILSYGTIRDRVA